MPMTKEQKRAAIALAWADYRAASQRIDRNTPWDVYLDTDGRLFRRYLAAEKEILAEPEPRAA
jgi:hypothetical protein